jgi:hypothetical protein
MRDLLDSIVFLSRKVTYAKSPDSTSRTRTLYWHLSTDVEKYLVWLRVVVDKTQESLDKWVERFYTIWFIFIIYWC